MSGVFVEAINLIQDLNRKIDGVVSAPHLDDYPARIDTMEVPLALADIAEGSEWQIPCKDSTFLLQVEVTVFLNPLAQDDLGTMKRQAFVIGQNFRDRYRDANSYLNNDGVSKMLLERDDHHLWINPATPFGFTGHIVDDYPRRSGTFYHLCRITFGVSGRGGDC